MLCNCKYFNNVNGKLICSVCGKPAHAENKVEDKMMPAPANKARKTSH